MSNRFYTGQKVVYKPFTDESNDTGSKTKSGEVLTIDREFFGYGDEVWGVDEYPDTVYHYLSLHPVLTDSISFANEQVEKMERFIEEYNTVEA